MSDHNQTECPEERRHGCQVSPDPHGLAAMLLVESLIHCLTARSLITVPEAIEVVSIAAEVEEELCSDMPQADEVMRVSKALLESVRESLSTELARE